MPDNKLSVEDILGEIEVNRAKAENRATSGDSGRVDDIIRDILLQRQERELRAAHRTPSQKEQEELRREIEVQTRSLTKQLEKLQQVNPAEPAPASAVKPTQAPIPQRREPPAAVTAESPGKGGVPGKGDAPNPFPHSRKHRAAPGGMAPFPESHFTTGALHNAPSGKRPVLVAPGLAPQAVRPEPEAAPIQEPPEHTEANPAGRVQLNEITGHFGNFKMEDVSVEDVYLKTEITPANYRDYKNNRSRKVADFNLKGRSAAGQPEPEAAEAPAAESQAAPAAPPEPNELAAAQREAEQRFQTEYEYKYEYTSPSQAAAIQEDLRGLKQSLRGKLIGLGAVSINALLLCFSSMHNGAFWVLGMLPVTPFLYSVINFVLLTAALVLSIPMLRDAAESFSKRQPTKDWLILSAALLCLVSNAVFLFQPAALLQKGVYLFAPLAVLLLFLGHAAKYQIAARAVDNFRFVSSDAEKYAVTLASGTTAARQMTKGLLEGEPVLARNNKTGFFERFFARSFHWDISDRIFRISLLVALPAAVLLAVGGYIVSKNIFVSFSLLSGIPVLGCGFMGILMVSLPLHDTAGVVRRFSGMIPGYAALEACKDVNALLVNGCDLFPDKSISLRSIKTFQGKRVDDAIVDVASLSVAANSALKTVFMDIIGGRTEILRPVDSVQYEDLMGMSAWVADRRVLIGNRDMMVNHSIAVPKQEYEDQYRADGGEVVYLAAEGELCAAFILEIAANPTAENVVGLLVKNDMHAVVRSVDSFLTAELLARVFQTDVSYFKVLPSRLHAEYAEQTKEQPRADTLLGSNGSLFGYVVSLAASKKLYRCIQMGGLLYLVSAIAGLLLTVVMLLLNHGAGLGCMQMLLYFSFFLLVYWLYEKNMKL